LIPKTLKPILSNCPYIDTIVTLGEQLPHYDDHLSLMALPILFPEKENTIPCNIPYLFPDKTLVEQWRIFFETQKQNVRHLRVGLCWIADLKNDESRPPIAHRSISLEQLQPLLQLATVDFYSLQKDAQDLPPDLHIKTFGPSFDGEHGAFMDTAAIMKHLDLVISVDTSVAHLAGALGVPVWILLPFSSDWRWTAHHTDSVWYPTLRVFKQQIPLSWQPVIDEVVKALHELIAQHS
jgi:hypothetical protein